LGSSVYIVTAKLPERDREFEYRIRSALQEHEHLVRESELTVVTESETRPVGKTKGK
jgi:hypothetical protein